MGSIRNGRCRAGRLFILKFVNQSSKGEISHELFPASADFPAGAVCAALLTTMTACGGGSAAPAADSADSSADGGTVKVGLLHSLTGSMAISETSVRDAEVLAIDEINKAGGVNGCQIEYVEEDGAFQPSTFATKAEKLIDSDGVATIFGCWTSSSRKAVKPIVEDYDALLWYPVQYEGMESSTNIVYTGAAPNQQIVPAIEYLLDKGYKKFLPARLGLCVPAHRKYDH